MRATDGGCFPFFPTFVNFLQYSYIISLFKLFRKLMGKSTLVCQSIIKENMGLILPPCFHPLHSPFCKCRRSPPPVAGEASRWPCVPITSSVRPERCWGQAASGVLTSPLITHWTIKRPGGEQGPGWPSHQLPGREACHWPLWVSMTSTVRERRWRGQSKMPLLKLLDSGSR